MDASALNAVRSYNRFFAAKLNVFDRYALGTTYTLVEGRIIGEIGRHDDCTANKISEIMNMDKSYLSRILAQLESKDLISRKISDKDGRQKILSLSDIGMALFNQLEFLSIKQAEKMLSGLDGEQVEKVLSCMRFIQSTLGEKHV